MTYGERENERVKEKTNNSHTLEEIIIISPSLPLCVRVCEREGEREREAIPQGRREIATFVCSNNPRILKISPVIYIYVYVCVCVCAKRRIFNEKERECE